ncbi:MAG: hypothetical protein UR31_C0011G0029 [Parcubacteria group bacterium GW2011_GWA2_33_14]|uniref:Uncharacterized protein n=1 Tax=Candidatus Staskawiczbacteria bacterium RIFCSPHIGHO2_02_FULL_33_16 TaxID=1802204 RepID=A0A1G2HTQ3_9BACT|nr:MAG: hypothetical protein UR31_C0011G0029 [Parcubacteria group bacterium GW2011_GWA2_33_14]OGZ65835.1 MAG: hypothetical protein A3D34_03235 [Candidatus Staskawiczbacteria bacterium RIFCSPHIGHO2_02_FULL_33_16]OGZ70491.1 MAG: hypothetical protein A2980_00880 [Candidatus Staskawiczbacteria bacterium RIFCSPLOWO2_01_FULL_33_13]
MLKPTKYTDLNISLIAVVSELLKIFKVSNSITYSELLNKVIQKKGIIAKNIFLPALSFLFLMDKITYYEKKDIIEYKNEN